MRIFSILLGRGQFAGFSVFLPRDIDRLRQISKNYAIPSEIYRVCKKKSKTYGAGALVEKWKDVCVSIFSILLVGGEFARLSVFVPPKIDRVRQGGKEYAIRREK